MAERYDERLLRNQLDGLDADELIIFGLSVAERMLPNFRRFVTETSWGDESVLRRALDLGWQRVSEDSIDARRARSLEVACLEQAPNTEDFTSVWVSAALDAANSAANVMALLTERDVERAVEIASYGRDSVDLIVQEIENMPSAAPDLEERIRLHPMMQRELRNQSEAVKLIAAGMSPGEAAKRWRSPILGSTENE